MRRRNGSILTEAVMSMAILILLAACSSTRTTGEEFDDAVITSKVKTKLVADPEVNPFEIDVDTLDRIVTLRGTVETQAARMEAEKLARGTHGVKGVVNRINFGDHTAGEEINDARIASKIKAKLAADPDINPFDIDVDADLGIVTLSGVVQSAHQKHEAETIARGTSGVKGIRNQIKVEPHGSGR